MPELLPGGPRRGTARGPGEERLLDRCLRTVRRGVRGVRRRTQGARRVGGEVRRRVPGEGARVPDAGGERGAGERRVILERLYIENYKQLRDSVELYPPEAANRALPTSPFPGAAARRRTRPPWR